MMKHLLAFAALAALAPLAIGQQYLPRPNAADPAAVVPPFRYESAFTGYASYRDQDLAPWREVNDEVARIGGHVKMFGGAAQRSAPQAPPAGHKGH